MPLPCWKDFQRATTAEMAELLAGVVAAAAAVDLGAQAQIREAQDFLEVVAVVLAGLVVTLAWVVALMAAAAAISLDRAPPIVLFHPLNTAGCWLIAQVAAVPEIRVLKPVLAEVEAGPAPIRQGLQVGSEAEAEAAPVTSRLALEVKVAAVAVLVVRLAALAATPSSPLNSWSCWHDTLPIDRWQRDRC